MLIHANTEEIVSAAVANPLTMIASDGFDISAGQGHPRSAGTFSRVLGRYVRDQHAISLMEGLRKMTLMPAQRLEARVPAMRNKGRIRLGADADLTLFDPQRIIDRASFERPAEFSYGVQYVFVNGESIVENGVPRRDLHPGRPIRVPILGE